MADNVAEEGELVVGSSEEVKLPRRRSAFPKPTRSTRDMSCLIHLDVNGKATHTNRHCKFVNNLEASKQSRKNRPRGKGKGKKKEEESKDSSDMDEDVDPKHAAKSDDKGKNPFAKKAPVYHTFLDTPTVRQQKTSLRILMATLPPFSSDLM